MSQPATVHAVITDNKGRLLLRNRDASGKNPWEFPGTKIEAGETFEAALAKELMVELGCDIGTIGSRCFREERDTQGMLDVGFLINSTRLTESFRLREGQQLLQWFALDELVELPLSPLVSRHISLLMKEVVGVDAEIAHRLENKLLSHYGLSKKNDRVYYTQRRPALASMQCLLLLKELASYRGLPFCRVCLHQTDDEPIHEMLMIHTRPYKAGPLKQLKTSLSYHMLDGAVEVCLYDEDGKCFWKTDLDSRDDSKSRFVRLEAHVFRSIESKTPYTIFLEVASGPFRDDDTIWL